MSASGCGVNQESHWFQRLRLSWSWSWSVAPSSVGLSGEKGSVSDFPLRISAEFAGLRSAERLWCVRSGSPPELPGWSGSPLFKARNIFKKTRDGVADSCFVRSPRALLKSSPVWLCHFWTRDTVPSLLHQWPHTAVCHQTADSFAAKMPGVGLNRCYINCGGGFTALLNCFLLLA